VLAGVLGVSSTPKDIAHVPFPSSFMRSVSSVSARG
jgi:hypothetical protein